MDVRRHAVLALAAVGCVACGNSHGAGDAPAGADANTGVLDSGGARTGRDGSAGGDASAEVIDGGGARTRRDAAAMDASAGDAGVDAPRGTDARVGDSAAGEDAAVAAPPDAGRDAALPTSCVGLESFIVDYLSIAAECADDGDCVADYNPLCGADSSRFATGCFVYRNAGASPQLLVSAASACSQLVCVGGCLPADCDCADPPKAACVAGACRAEVTQAELADCGSDADCTVVPYAHCCGATKRAINADFVDAYEAHPEWQRFDDPATCAVVGVCADDSAVTEARCEAGACALVFP